MHRRRREVHAWMRVARRRQLTPTLEQRRKYAEDALDAPRATIRRSASANGPTR